MLLAMEDILLPLTPVVLVPHNQITEAIVGSKCNTRAIDKLVKDLSVLLYFNWEILSYMLNTKWMWNE